MWTDKHGRTTPYYRHVWKQVNISRDGVLYKLGHRLALLSIDETGECYVLAWMDDTCTVFYDGPALATPDMRGAGRVHLVDLCSMHRAPAIAALLAQHGYLEHLH